MNGKSQMTWSDKLAALQNHVEKLQSQINEIELSRCDYMAIGVEKLAEVKEAAAGVAEQKNHIDLADKLYKDAERIRNFAQKIRAGKHEAGKTSC
jgi:hypothetical protein